jgi:hypothetical protein
MKVYKIELMVIDHENVGQEEIKNILENSKFIYPNVIDIKSSDIEWLDEHPLNKRDTMKSEFDRIFS